MAGLGNDESLQNIDNWNELMSYFQTEVDERGAGSAAGAAANTGAGTGPDGWGGGANYGVGGFNVWY